MPYGEAARGRGREGKIDPERQPPNPGLSLSLLGTAPAPAHAGMVRRQPGDPNNRPQGDLPAGGPTSPFAGSGAGALPLPPRACNPTPHLAAAAHPPPPFMRAGNRFPARSC